MPAANTALAKYGAGQRNLSSSNVAGSVLGLDRLLKQLIGTINFAFSIYHQHQADDQ
jgi:hypothetical protein